MEFLTTPILAAHLICMNLAAGAPLVGLWCEWREAKGCSLAGEAGRWLVGWSWLALLAGSGLGLAVGWGFWSEAYQARLALLSAKIYWGILEWLFSVVLTGGYFLWWYARPRVGTWQRWARAGVALLTGTNLLYHFPLLFFVLNQLPAGIPGAETQPLTSAEFRTYLVSGSVLARAVHFTLASAAVCGAAWLLLASRRSKHDPAAAQQLAVWGGWLAAVPTIAQLVVGLWVLTQLGPHEQAAIMGGQLLGSLALVLSLLLWVWLMHLLMAIALGKGTPQHWQLAVMVLLVVVLLMTFVERATRGAARYERRRPQPLVTHVSLAAYSPHLSFPASLPCPF